jgi:DNA repair protein RecN (Recombination protein N)
MLLELVVENYAVVERLRVPFHPGLNVLTGETGSGKSIVVDALGLLLGGRASVEAIRSGAERARVSGIFEKPRAAAFGAVLAEAGIDSQEEEILIEREILLNGKSRAYIDSRPVTAAFLKEIAPWLGDIHGQHDQQRLFSHEAQRDMLDEFGHSAVDHVATAFEKWRRTGEELEELDRLEQERLRLADLWAFQKKEIEAVAPHPSEDADLEQQRRLLSNVNRLAESATAAYDALYDAPESCLAGLRAAIKRLDDLCRIDETMIPLRDGLKPAAIVIEDASQELRGYIGRLESDPARLEEVETRLAALDKLKRKYGQSIGEVLEFLGTISRQLSAAESAGARRDELKREQAKFAREYETAASALTEARKKTARKLEKRVETELGQLAMERTAFRVEITPAAWSAHGTDAIAFLVSANLGEAPKPLEKTASGGELSRIALALKTCLNEVKKQTIPPTLVFDEVDAGIGGSVAVSVGKRLKQLAGNQQVLCVTHLAQIAGYADHQYYVEKREQKGRIVTSIQELAREARIAELGRMIAGANLTPETLKTAEQMLR